MAIDKLYLITRNDLSFGQQAVQAAHALQAFNLEWPRQAKTWHDQSNTLALLALPNEADLGVVYERALRKGIPVSAFREPDRGNELTAIALGPSGKNLCRDLPLALQDTRKNETKTQENRPQ
jgi:hypothetical protein